MIPYRVQQLGKHVRQECAVLRGMLHLDNHDPAGTILLAGSGRSGTTWMSQVLNHANPYRDVFEPFHPQHIKQVSDWPQMRYIPAESDDVQLARVCEGLLAGRVRSRWTDQYNRKAIAKRRLVKAIRTDLMLGYIRRTLPQVRLLFAMRHPCAVAYSRVKLKWDTHLDELLAQPALMRDHLEPYRETIERAERDDDVWIKHLTMWCIENLVPLRELTPGDAHLMRYEDLCQHFDGEVAGLFAYLGRDVPKGIRTAALQRSASFRRDSAILRGGDLISDWQRHVSTKQIDAMLDTLAAFGLSHLYDEGAAPHCDRDAIYIDSTTTHKPFSTHKEAA